MVKRHNGPDVRGKMTIVAGQAHKREDSAPTGAGSPGAALRQHPARLLTTSWPWRSLGYLATTPVVAALWLLTCWPLVVLAGVPLGHIERWRLRWVDRHPATNPHSPMTRNGFGGWVRLRISERASWAELLYGVVLVPVSVLTFALFCIVLLVPAAVAAASAALFVILILGIDPGAVTAVSDLRTSTINENPLAQLGLAALGTIAFAAGLYLVTLAAEGQRYLCRILISEPPAGEDEQLTEVTRSRARISSAFDQERRRIERDLHDGAQQRLTSLVLTLATMKYQLGRGQEIQPLLEQATTDAQHAVDELREIVHGIYPSALREHDLSEALDDVLSRAELAGLTSDVQLDVPPALSPDVEVGLYFAVSELVTNVTKHSGATCLAVRIKPTSESSLHVSVEDNGHGGASIEGGTGLLGVVDRIETLGGTLHLSSPPGGPTRVNMEVPCESS